MQANTYKLERNAIKWANKAILDRINRHGTINREFGTSHYEIAIYKTSYGEYFSIWDYRLTNESMRIWDENYYGIATLVTCYSYLYRESINA